MAKDLYNILGVSKGATQDEIKKAFRKLAHQHHPDKEGGDETKFKEINAAYQILSDPEKRKRYDQFGEAGVNGPGGGGAGGMNWEDVMRQGGFGGGFRQGAGGGIEFDLGDIFSDFFGGGARGQRRQSKGQDIQVDVEISFSEAAFGVSKTVELYKSVSCSKCHGNGAEPGTPIKECAHCKGKGVVERIQQSFFGAVRAQSKCPDCNGEGKIPEKKCTQCHGTGAEKKDTTYEVKIPGGIDDGQTLRIGGQGEAGEHGSHAGDLYVVVHVKQEQEWKRVDDDVLAEVDVPYSMLVLGGKILVNTLDGAVEMKVPAGTEAGQLLRLRGKGVPQLQGSGRGDHLVKVGVKIPKRPGFKYKKLLKQLEQFEAEE